MAGGETPAVDKAIPFLLFAVFVGVLLRLAERRAPVWFRPPYTVMLFVAGLLMSWWAEAHPWSMGRLGRSLKDWQQVHPHVILFVLLPPLLYESASAMDFHVFSKVSGQSVLLASLGVFLSVGLTAVCIKLTFATYEWGWGVSLLLGSILSATDPVAVVAVLQTLRAPHKLSMMIEGESLLNDGTAFVLFLLFKDMAGHVDQSAGSALLTFAQLSIGGPAWGYLSAVIFYAFVDPIYNDMFSEIAAMMVTVFGVFFVGEDMLHVSGVLAVVCFGLLMAKSGKYALSVAVNHAGHDIWSFVGWVCNTVIFVLSGIVIYDRVINASRLAWDPLNWLYVFVLYILLHFVRFTVIGILYPLLSRMGYGLSLKEAFILGYGGLRGAVGLALSLLVELDEHIARDTKDKFNFHIAGIVMLTLLVNGSTAGWVYRKLKLYPPNKHRAMLSKGALKLLRDEVGHSLKTLQGGWLQQFTSARWTVVTELVPNFHKDANFDSDGHLTLHMDSVDDTFHRHMLKMKLGSVFAAVTAAQPSHRDLLSASRKKSSGRVVPTAEAKGDTGDEIKALSVGGDSSDDEAVAAAPHVRDVTVESDLDADLAALGLDSDSAKPSPGPLAADSAAELREEERDEVAPLRSAAQVMPEDQVTGTLLVHKASVAKFSLSQGMAAITAVAMDSPSARTAASVVVDASVTPLSSAGPTSEDLAPGPRVAADEMHKKSTSQYQAYLMTFNALKASFSHQYEKQFIGDKALMNLIEAADAAMEVARQQHAQVLRDARAVARGTRGSYDPTTELPASLGSASSADESSTRGGSAFGASMGASLAGNTFFNAKFGGSSFRGSPIDKAASVICDVVDVPQSVSMVERLPLEKIPRFGSAIEEGVRFRWVQSAVETLVGFIQAQQEVCELTDFGLEDKLLAMSVTVKNSLIRLQAENQGLCVVLRALLPAKVLLQRQLDVVRELEHERGMLDESTAHEITEIITERVHDLHRFAPSAKLLRELHDTNMEEHSRKIERKTAARRV